MLEPKANATNNPTAEWQTKIVQDTMQALLNAADQRTSALKYLLQISNKTDDVDSLLPPVDFVVGSTVARENFLASSTSPTLTNGLHLAKDPPPKVGLNGELVNTGATPAYALWIADTGAGVHLMNADTLGEDFAYQTDKLKLSTAKCVVMSTNATRKDLGALGDLECRLLSNSPNVVSVGKLIEDSGLGFVWFPSSPPLFVMPNGQVVVLDVQNHVPVFTDATVQKLGDTTEANPAIRLRSKTPDADFIGPIRPGGLPLDDAEQPQNAPRRARQRRLTPEQEETEAQRAERKKHEEYVHTILHLDFCGLGANCETCRVAKQRRHRAKPVPEDEQTYAKEYGKKTSMDWYEPGVKKLGAGIGGHKYALVMLDEATHKLTINPSKNKDTRAVAESLTAHIGSNLNLIKGIYADGDKAFRKLCKIMSIPFRTATPRTPTSNARHERVMEIVNDAIRCLLYQAGLPPSWWPMASQYFATGWNLYRPCKRNGNKTPFEAVQEEMRKRAKKEQPEDESEHVDKAPFAMYPFGCRCTYVPLMKQQPRRKQRRAKSHYPEA